MRTTVTLDDDVVALIENERERTGESFKVVVNRLLRKSVRATPRIEGPPLPRHRGRPLIDITDVSAALAMLEDERRARHDGQ